MRELMDPVSTASARTGTSVGPSTWQGRGLTLAPLLNMYNPGHLEEEGRLEPCWVVRVVVQLGDAVAGRGAGGPPGLHRRLLLARPEEGEEVKEGSPSSSSRLRGVGLGPGGAARLDRGPGRGAQREEVLLVLWRLLPLGVVPAVLENNNITLLSA